MAFIVLFECLLLLFLYINIVYSSSNGNCPEKCVCENVASKLRVRCGGIENPIDSISGINFEHIVSDIVKLNLSANNLLTVTRFRAMPSLRKLDLSKNKISLIEDGAFDEIPDLKQIDLSYNSLRTLHLNLIENLSALKQIDISNNPLNCNCEILSFTELLQNKSIKSLSNPKCTFSKSTKVQYLRKLKQSLRNHCATTSSSSPLSTTTITTIDVQNGTTLQLHPTEDQIVFEGDSLRLNCLVTNDNDLKTNITWNWLNQDAEQFNDIGIENKYSSFSRIVDSSLYISHVKRNHTGAWKCRLITSNVNETKTVTIIVISNDTKYCPITLTKNNKGVYSWPKTIVGYTVDLPCQGPALDRDVRAYYKCSRNGNWFNLNTTQCPYISETTRILEQFSKINLTLTKGKVYESAVHLKRNYTSNLKILKDKMDIVFIARTVVNYLQFLRVEKDLGHICADIINNMLKISKSFLNEANEEDKTCGKFIQSVEEITEFITISRTRFATQEFKLKRDAFNGLTCTWYTDNIYKENPILNCNNNNNSFFPIDAERIMEARIQIPSTLFQQLEYEDNFVPSQRLFLALFSNSVLFPNRFVNGTDCYASVVSAKLVNVEIKNLANPVHVIIRLNNKDETTAPVPVWWDVKMNKGRGGWNANGCQISHYLHDFIVFHCNQLSYYSILQKLSLPELKRFAVPEFRVSHPAVYIGAFVLLSTLLISIVTYLLCFPAIQMAKKAKHSVMNTWISVMLLCFMYTFGIYQTEEPKVCRSVGLVLHYLTLSTLLWMCVTVSNMYKRLNNKTETTVLTDDGLQVDQPVQKPILGLYLIGWGIALIVCGISGAVNMRDYASRSYCFLESIPALSALFVPVSILFGFIVVFLLLIRCTIRNTDTIAQLSEGTQGTENVDLDLLEPNVPVSGNGSVKSTSTRSSMIEDSEHGSMTQLRAHLISLLIFLFGWFCAAISLVRPFQYNLHFEQDLFNILYALFVSAFGLFNLFFYCIARNDVRTQWSLARRWFKQKQSCFRNRSVSDTNPPPNLSSNSNQIVAEAQVTSRSSSRSSSQAKSVSRHSNNLKVTAATDLNTTIEETKTPNVDLIVLHRQQYRTNNTIPVYELSSLNGAAEMFYNPHQSGVARKFFRKQRRHMMKHNNLGNTTRRKDTGSINSVKSNKTNSGISSNLFGTSSKVNNTNIHVEQIHECKQRNPNILSDTYSDHEYSNRLNIPVHQLMLSTKKLRSHPIRKPEEPEHDKDNMRTVSQQCSLEYSSETLSERVLDKDLDLDASIACSDFTDYKPDTGKVYVNPMDNFRLSRGSGLRSSVSTSDVDELYAQIRHGFVRSHTLATLNDAELHSTNIRRKYYVNNSDVEDAGDKSETTV